MNRFVWQSDSANLIHFPNNEACIFMVSCRLSASDLSSSTFWNLYIALAKIKGREVSWKWDMLRQRTRRSLIWQLRGRVHSHRPGSQPISANYLKQVCNHRCRAYEILLEARFQGKWQFKPPWICGRCGVFMKDDLILTSRTQSILNTNHVLIWVWIWP